MGLRDSCASRRVSSGFVLEVSVHNRHHSDRFRPVGGCLHGRLFADCKEAGFDAQSLLFFQAGRDGRRILISRKFENRVGLSKRLSQPLVRVALFPSPRPSLNWARCWECADKEIDRPRLSPRQVKAGFWPVSVTDDREQFVKDGPLRELVSEFDRNDSDDVKRLHAKRACAIG